MRWPWQQRNNEAAAIAAAAEAPANPPAEAPDEPTTPTNPIVNIDGWRRVARFYPTDGLDPWKFRSICREADQGFTWRLMELLDDVFDDPEISSQYGTRKLAVAGSQFHFDPGDESDLGKQIADDAEKFVKRIPSFKQLRLDLLDAIGRGFACSVPKWATVNGRWDMVGHTPIESRFFRFDKGDLPLVETIEAPGGQPLPEGVFLHVFRNKAGIIARGGIGRILGKLYIYKNLNLVDCASFLERFGHPHVQVELPRGIKEDSPEFERAKRAALTLIADCVGLVPAGVTIKILDAINKTSNLNDLYLAFIRFMDEAIAKTINGQTLTTTGSQHGGLGHGGEAKQHGEVRQDYKELDAGQLDDTLNTQLIKPWTLWHYGPNAPVPILVSDVGAPVDEAQLADTLLKRAQTYVVLKRDLRMKLSKNQLHNEFEAIEPETKEDTLGGDEPEPVKPPPGTPGTPPGKDGEPADLSARDGACPHCSGFFTFAEAEKKKRSLTWGPSRSS